MQMVEPVTLGNLHVEQMFIILDNLSTPVILGCDFLTKHNLIMDFSQQTGYHADDPSFMLNMPVKKLNPCNTLTLDHELPQAIPSAVTSNTLPVDMPTGIHPDLLHIINSHQQLFSTQLGKTTTIEHVIDTGEASPIKVPPRPIPFHFAEKVHK